MNSIKSSPKVLAWLAGLLFLCVAPPGFAEKADRDKPIDLEADTVIVEDAKKTSTYQGNVILTQGTLVIRADKLVVKEDAQGFQSGTAYGNPANFRQKREGYNEYVEGFASRIEYDSKQDKVQLFTNARMKRNEDEERGNYISYDAKTELFQVIGGAKTDAGGGRVHATIQPKVKPNTAAPPSTIKPLEDVPGAPSPLTTQPK